jgi:hypothetical protein
MCHERSGEVGLGNRIDGQEQPPVGPNVIVSSRQQSCLLIPPGLVQFQIDIDLVAACLRAMAGKLSASNPLGSWSA